MDKNNTTVLLKNTTSVLEKNNSIVLNNDMNVGERVKSARKYAKLSQEELALAVGCTQGAISKIERGDQNDSGLLIKIAKACNVNPLYFAFEDEEITPELYSLNEKQKRVIQAMQHMTPYGEDAMVKIGYYFLESEAPTAATGTDHSISNKKE